MKTINLNKRTVLICIFIFVILLIMYNDRKKYVFGTDIPKAFVVINNENHAVIHGDANWQLSLPGENVPGNGHLVDTKKELKNTCSFIEVTPDSQLSFDVKYEDHIQTVALSSIDVESNSFHKKTEDILNSPYKFKAPSEKGDYYYIFYVNWDLNHNVDYLFKIKVV